MSFVDGNCDPSSPEPFVPDFEYASEAFTADIPTPGSFVLGLDVDSDAVTDACFKVPDLGAIDMVTLYIVNDEHGTPSLVAHLPDGTTAIVDSDL